MTKIRARASSAIACASRTVLGSRRAILRPACPDLHQLEAFDLLRRAVLEDLEVGGREVLHRLCLSTSDRHPRARGWPPRESEGAVGLLLSRVGRGEPRNDREDGGKAHQEGHRAIVPSCHRDCGVGAASSVSWHDPYPRVDVRRPCRACDGDLQHVVAGAQRRQRQFGRAPGHRAFAAAPRGDGHRDGRTHPVEQHRGHGGGSRRPATRRRAPGPHG